MRTQWCFFVCGSNTSNRSSRQGSRCSWAFRPGMYSKKCIANSFMRVKHVPERGRCWGELLSLLYT